MNQVRIRYHHKPEGWWADSPELPGFSAASDTVDEVRSMALEGVGFATGTQPETIEENAPSRDPR